MTGEITLRGRVLPVGGIKEKFLAAQRMGIQKVIVPQENAPDIREVPAETRDQLEIILVSHIDHVLPHALNAHKEGSPTHVQTDSSGN
jgi:ATP-dependent Lon protease